MSPKKLLGFFLGLCFTGFAGLQYNDTHAFAWIATYLVAAVFSGMVAFDKMNRTLLLTAFVTYAAGAIYFWREHWKSEINIFVSGGISEVLGLAICSLAMLGFALLYRSTPQLHPRSMLDKSKKWAGL